MFGVWDHTQKQQVKVIEVCVYIALKSTYAKPLTRHTGMCAVFLSFINLSFALAHLS